MRWRIVFFLLAGYPFLAKADHITGGQMWYKFTTASNGNYVYNVSLKLYMRCNSGRQFPDPIYVSVFDKATNERVRDISTPLSHQENIAITDNNPCVTNPPNVCYVVGYYNFGVSLPASEKGFTISAQINYRIANITNLSNGYGQIGATYTADIPGMGEVASAIQNASAQFTGSDLVIICANNNFSYSFAATDADGDELRYSFCDAYIANGGGGRGSESEPPSRPPYPSVPYASDFSGSAPLGNKVKIDPVTGLITGRAPGEGKYVVTVCVQEIRNGITIATQRKDLQINVADCNIAAASLLPDYQLCGDSKKLNIVNQSNSPLIQTYNWEFFDNRGNSLFTSDAATTSYTFPDTGMYSVKLVINRGGPCSDSNVAPAIVYPGFKPSFNVNGVCISKPTQFTDVTTSVYGNVTSWEWDFDDLQSTSNISFTQNATYTYTVTGLRNVQLTATDSKGCRSTVSKAITIIDKPPIALAFRDTLICINDNVPLLAAGIGVFSWSPDLNLVNGNTPNPTVSPPVTTTYNVHLDEDGCINDDSVRVNVVDHVSLKAMSDTTICSSDTIQLKLQSDGLKYAWTPAAQMDNSLAASPNAFPANTTQYQVTAVIGSCFATDDIIVKTIPYPVSDAGADKLICYDASIQLEGYTDGNEVLWTPPQSLDNASGLNPLAKPTGTTSYILYAFDTKGCPKPGVDTVLITMLPDINAFAGHDTSIVIGQPLQLQASGGTGFSWFPSVGLSASNIANPMALYNTSSAGILYKVYISNEAECLDSAFVTVKVFSTKPTVFVPTAFTPNSDGRNDRLRPIAAGIKDIEYFNVYNRWGQLVFSTHTNGDGWDGSINGEPQRTGTFVWVVKATDYNGGAYFEKGITTLVR